ncbi:MAG: hypothetical protein QXH32_02035 [Candidatus Caldarchaeum sp.]
MEKLNSNAVNACPLSVYVIGLSLSYKRLHDAVINPVEETLCLSHKSSSKSILGKASEHPLYVVYPVHHVWGKCVAMHGTFYTFPHACHARHAQACFAKTRGQASAT